MIHRKTLTLNLMKEWYDKIEAGTKKKEYRDRSPYYDSRFIGKSYDEVLFINGYHPGARRMTLEIVKVTKTNNEWIIHLGKKLK